MERWDLTSLPPSSEKRRPREAGPGAPPEPSSGRQMPRVLFSTPECRGVVLDFEEGETMGDHQVRERAVLHVVTGRVSIESAAGEVECGAGSLVVFEPSERHTVHALENARLLLLLAPWPAPLHYTPSEAPHAQELPANATIEPDSLQ
jgi:quercetin dioxygenase-like cupin family protein